MKIMFYYTHSESLGHATRSYNLINRLAESHDVFVIEAGKEQEYFKNKSKKVKRAILPYPIYKRDFFYIRPGKKDIEKEKIKLKIIKKQLEKYKPDVFITEYFPIGRPDINYELMPIIKYIKKHLKKIAIVGSIGYPFASQKVRFIKGVERDYDLFLMHFPEELDYSFMIKYIRQFMAKQGFNYNEKSDKQKEVFDLIKAKTKFTGYIINKKKIKKSKKSPKDGFILVSRGSGATFPNIIINAIMAKNYLSNDLKMKVVAGPVTSDKQLSLFYRLARNFKNIEIIKQTELAEEMVKAKMSISMSGYNTSNETFYLKKKAIFIPLYKKNKETAIEQGYRAYMLKELMNNEVIEQPELRPKLLAEKIKSMLEKNNAEFEEKIRYKEEWFNGVENSVKEIESLLEKKKEQR